MSDFGEFRDVAELRINLAHEHSVAQQARSANDRLRKSIEKQAADHRYKKKALKAQIHHLVGKVQGQERAWRDLEKRLREDNERLKESFPDFDENSCLKAQAAEHYEERRGLRFELTVSRKALEDSIDAGRRERIKLEKENKELSEDALDTACKHHNEVKKLKKRNEVLEGVRGIEGALRDEAEVKALNARIKELEEKVESQEAPLSSWSLWKALEARMADNVERTEGLVARLEKKLEGPPPFVEAEPPPPPGRKEPGLNILLNLQGDLEKLTREQAIYKLGTIRELLGEEGGKT